ncbi:MAG: hypothetical protein AAGA96_13100 [Verrucomicrobiota bacterium]
MKIKRFSTSLFVICLMSSSLLADVFPGKEDFDPYGGYLNIKGEATGRFHLEEIDGRHFLITPDGHGFLSIGVTHTGGLAFPEESSFDYFEEKCARDWNMATQELVTHFRDWGYNSLGYGGHQTTRELLPHFADGQPSGKVSSWMAEGIDFPDVFSKGWKEEARGVLQTMARRFPETPNLIGVYWADMPAWPFSIARKKAGKTWVDAIRELPADAPGKIRYEQFLRENGDQASDEDFLVLIAREVYATLGPLSRELWPNTLIFGERYPGRALPWEVIQEALPYIDVVTVQPNGTRFSDVPFERLYQETGKPIMICDHNMSFRTPEHPNVMWDTLPDVASVGRAYEAYLNDGFSTPFLLGYNKCQYIDRFKGAAKILKQGLLKEDGTPYEELVDWVQETNWQTHERFINESETGE